MKKSVYEIYNIAVGKSGKSFTLCDKHYRKWKPKLPNTLMVNKIAEKSLKNCNECENE